MHQLLPNLLSNSQNTNRLNFSGLATSTRLPLPVTLTGGDHFSRSAFSTVQPNSSNGSKNNGKTPLLFGKSLKQDYSVETITHHLTLAQSIVSEHPEILVPGATSYKPTALDESKTIPGLFYKREDQTATHAFKIRGAEVAMAEAMSRGKKDFVTVSTGNHALGVLKAAEALKPDSVKIIVPKAITEAKLEKLMSIVDTLDCNAEVIVRGEGFDDAKALTLDDEVDCGYHFIDPYDDPWVVAGQGTIGLELAEQLKTKIDSASQNGEPIKEVVILSAFGGGGLSSGVFTALKEAFKGSNIKLKFVAAKLDNFQSEFGDAVRVAAPSANNLSILTKLGARLDAVPDEKIQSAKCLAEKDLDTQVEGAAGLALGAMLLDPENRMPDENRLTVCITSGGNV